MVRPKLARPNYRLRPYDGIHYICWSDGRGTKRRSTGERDRGKAEEVLAGFLASLETLDEPEAKTISAILDGYVEDRKGEVVDHQRIVDSAAPLKRHVGWVLIDDMTPMTSKLYTRNRRADGVGNGTIRRELTTLRAALSWAAGEKWITGGIPKVKLPTAPRPRDRWLTRQEAIRLRDACVSPHVRLFVEIALGTGARKGAIGDLTWHQVDFESGLIDFNDPERDETDKKRAIVPMNGRLREALLEAANIRRTDWVLEWNGGRAGNIKKAFERACKRAKLDGVTPHVLRHTAATWAAMAGQPMEKIARMLGHTDSRITEQVYAKHSPDYLRSTTESLE